MAWGLPLFTSSTPVPPGASLATAAPPAGAGLVRLLGQPPAEPPETAPVVVADSRFRLLGVVAPRSAGGNGLAVISVDGKPARAVGVGRELEAGLRVLSVGHRQVELGSGSGAPQITLSLPLLAEAQRGRPGDMPPGMVLNGVPGAMRVPPMQVPQPVPVPQGVPVPGALPYQPDGNPGSDDAADKNRS